MYDPEEEMVYGAAQQGLVREIVSKLHRDTANEDDYVQVFLGLARCLLLRLGGPREDCRESHPLAKITVIPMINDFLAGRTGYHRHVDYEMEMRFLVMRVMDEVIKSVTSQVGSSYLNAVRIARDGDIGWASDS